jgi:exonuclease III
MAARPIRTSWTKALLLACWNADGVRGRKQELDNFLGQHGIDICLLTETHLRSGDVFRLAKHVCHRNDQLTEGGETAFLVRGGIDHHAVPAQGLQHLEANAIQITLPNKPVKILAVYLSPSGPLIASDLSDDWRWSSRHHGGWPKCQACRIDFQADHEKRQTLAWLCW